MTAIIDLCRGQTWQQVRDAGNLPDLLAAFDGRVSTMCREMGWERTGGIRDTCARLGIASAATEARKQKREQAQVSELAEAVHKHIRGGVCTYEDLSELCDRSRSSIEQAVEELRLGGFAVQVVDGETVRLWRTPPIERTVLQTGWGDSKLRFGLVSDTHWENLCACRDELESVYDFFAAEGITDVLHAGDLSDGPGNRGYMGHAQEVRDDCQTARQCVRHIIETYPRRAGMTTHYISSAKSHDGWELAASGFDMGRVIQDGFAYTRQGPGGDDVEWVEGREDMDFLGHDDVTFTVGPEGRTKIHLHHPDGGSAYAVSYQPQKWAEMLEGGAKPHLAILGHYHKLNWIRERNIQVVSAECMCWQTPFMRRKRIAAHVGYFLLELTVDADGTIRSFMPWEFPFFFGERRVVDLGRKAA